MKFPPFKRPQASIILLGSVFSIALAGHAPAQAMGFLDTSTLTNQCVNLTDLGCVDVIDSTSFTVFGEENLADTTTSSGFSAQTSSYTVSFDYAFTSDNGQAAFYSINGTQNSLISNLTGSSAFTVLNGQTLAFGVFSGQNFNPAVLEITNFNTTNTAAPTAVPGPLPLLGVVVAFGWIRRLRARCRGI